MPAASGLFYDWSIAMQTTATEPPADTAYVLTTRTGLSDHARGFSGAYSWWRSKTHPGKWMVSALDCDLGFSNDGIAVTDDFGNLARVPA